MTLARNTLLALVVLCAVGVAGSAVLATVSAQESDGGADCTVDRDGNGFVDISELFNVIDWYFDRTLCAAPESEPLSWTASRSHGGDPEYLVLSEEQNTNPWLLSVECSAEGSPAVFLTTAWDVIYAEEEDHDVSVDARIDGVLSEQTWSYKAPEGTLNDYMNHEQPTTFIEQLLTADEIEFTIPPSDDPYVVSFWVPGLDQHIEDASDVCGDS